MMIRGFTILSQSWYADVNLRDAKYVDDVTFGMYDDDEDGGTTGEMSIKWYELNGKPVPKLECFDDAWKILVEFTDVITMLGMKDNQNITPDKVAEILISRGFKDMTKRSDPIYTLCPYHQDGLGWDDCSDGFEGECQIDEARRKQGPTEEERFVAFAKELGELSTKHGITIDDGTLRIIENNS